MEITFEGRTALVTGAGSGIGEAIAMDLAAAGAVVRVADLSAEAAERVAAAIVDSGGQAVACRADVSDPAAVEALVAGAMDGGGLHLLVNNAGIAGDPLPVGEYPVDQWRKVIDVNLNAVFYGLHFGIPAMLASGGGAVVNMASILGSVGTAFAAPYVPSKHAVVGLTKAAAVEYATRGIRVNAVGPAYVDTPLLSHLEPERRDYLISRHPLGRLATPEEIAGLVTFLLSDRAAFITGSYHLADGGYTAV